MHKQKKRTNKKKQPVVKIPRVPTVTAGELIPLRIRTNLRYVELKTLNAPAATSAADAFSHNDPYDPRVALGGGQPTGWGTLEAQYTYFRTLAATMRIEVVNQESFPVSFNWLASTFDASGSPGDLITSSQGPFGGSKLLSQAGTTGAQFTAISRHSTAKITGSEAPYTADNFMGTTDGSLRVADKTYFTFGITSPSASTLVYGITYKIVLTYHVEFYGRKVF